ncbi:MAG: hypothetical protein ACOYL6_14905 [Bacteriovoracaceae bacterium]
MKKYFLIFIMMFQMNHAFAQDMSSSSNLITAIASYIYEEYSKIEDVKTVVSQLNLEIQKYGKVKNVKEKDFMLSQMIQKTQKLLPSVHSLFRPYVASEIVRMKSMRTYLNKKYYNTHNYIYQLVVTDMADIQHYLSWV